MKDRGYLLATASGAAAVAAATGGAQGADLARKVPLPAPVVAPPSWTGFYVGVHAGVNFQSVESTYAIDRFCVGCGEIGGANDFGFIGGGQIGYNWQFAPAWVLGVEGTISGLTGKATAPAQFNLNKGNGVEGRIDWLATVRGRIGWLMDPDTMIYGTGGVAWGGIKDSANPNGLSASNNPAFTNKSVSTTRTGWVAGGGVEHMFNGAWSHWTLGVEALFVDFNSFNGNAAQGTKSSSFRNRAAIGQVKLNYKF